MRIFLLIPISLLAVSMFFVYAYTYQISILGSEPHLQLLPNHPMALIPHASAQAANSSSDPDCVSDTSYNKITQVTNTTIIEIIHSPINPKFSCAMDIMINFKKKENPEEFQKNVHYDILIGRNFVNDIFVGENFANELFEVQRSLAGENYQSRFFSESGQVKTTISIKEITRTVSYRVIVIGTGPQNAMDFTTAGFASFDVHLQKEPLSPVIPSWIKNNAKWWSQGTVSDSEYISNIQYLGNQQIIDIPAQSSGIQKNVIPYWIKNNARFWSEGKITDSDYILGIQHLINKGIIMLGDPSVGTYPITLVDVKPYGDKPIELGVSIGMHLEEHYRWLARPSFSDVSYEQIEYELGLSNAKNRNDDDPVEFQSRATAKILDKHGFELFTADGIYDPMTDKITKLQFHKNSHYIPDKIKQIILTKSVEDKLVQDFLFRGGKHEPAISYLDGSQVNELKYMMDGNIMLSENKGYSFLTKDRPVFRVEYEWGHGIPEDPTLDLFFDGITHEKLSSKWREMR